MEISKKDLEWAVSQRLLSSEQAEALWVALESQITPKPKFDFAHVAYYFGALIVISAMTWFMTEAWEAFGGAGIFLISTLYAISFALVGKTLWYKEKLRVPGGLLFTLMVCMVPLAVYGLERWTGFWPEGDPGTYHDFHVWVKSSWFFMEIATLLVASVTLYFIRFPFLTAPIAFTLWYMSMDLTPLLFGQDEFSWNERLWVSVWFGLGMLGVAYLIDRRTREDFAFWIYLFGLIAFWGGLSAMHSDSELGKLFYCFINLGLMLLSLLLQRRAFMVFGAIGVFSYIGYLAFRVFQDSLLFPVALTLIGIFIIYVGVVYQKNYTKFERLMLENVPSALKSLLPTQRQ